MNRASDLNSRHGNGVGIRFNESPTGVIFAEIESPLCTATISLYGGQIVSWWPKHQSSPVLWLSKLAKFAPPTAIRGGVPICWPWFGAHPSNPKVNGHGYARLSPWEVISVASLPNGSIEVAFMLLDATVPDSFRLGSVRLSSRITVGEKLKISLETINDADVDISLTEGFHTYFQVGDVAEVRVHGLADCEYVDLTNEKRRCIQSGPITFTGETGKLFLNTAASCVIEDPRLKRCIRVEKTGSLSTAVWNPWASIAARMDDLGPVAWRDMVCVESANALSNIVIVKPGTNHTLTATYSAEPLL